MIFRKRLTKEQQESIIEHIEHVGLHGEISVTDMEVISKLFPGLISYEEYVEQKRKIKGEI